MNMIKKVIKFFIPTRFHSPIKESTIKFGLINYFWSDMKHLLVKANTEESRFLALKSKIIKNYHRLEKALSSPDFQAGRGLRAAEDLLFALENYRYERFDSNEVQVKVAIAVLQKFLDKQSGDMAFLKIKLINLKRDFCIEIDDIKEFGGTNEFDSDYFTSQREESFPKFSARRHSIRDYAHKEVDASLIKKAVEIAQRTPSVCNRQGWHVFSITNQNIINVFKKIHNGFSRKDQYLNTLLVICFSKNSFSYPLERHQGYTDGGLFSMSLMYALTHLGLATCPLNANITKDAEKIFRSTMELSDEFGIVMFIAVGHYKKMTTVPVSHRDQACKKITYKV